MTITARPAIDTVTTWESVGPANRNIMWKQYAEAFADVNTLAAQRHLMTRDEFDHVAVDPRIQKWAAWDDRGRMAGQSVITNRLDAWPLISPAYFQRVYPDHYRQRAIWYIGYICATPDAPTDTFRRLISDMAPQVFRSGGIAVMDFCTYNADTRQLPRITGLLLNHLNPNTRPGRLLDTQQFWAWQFDGQADQ